jgi:hypothetical protein
MRHRVFTWVCIVELVILATKLAVRYLGKPSPPISRQERGIYAASTFANPTRPNYPEPSTFRTLKRAEARAPERGVHAASNHAYQHAQKFSNALVNSSVEAT